MDFFDIYFAHRYDPLVPTQEVAHIFNCLINENKIKKWGICRWPLEKAIEIINFCHKNDLHPPSSQQFHYNLFNREAETESFPLFYSHNLLTVSYSPLAQGVLTGKYFLGTGKSTRAALISARKTMWDMQDEKILNVEAWRAVLEKFDLAPSAAAISFCLNRKEISRVLLGARNKTQLIENIKASNLPWQKIYEESFHGM